MELQKRMLTKKILPLLIGSLSVLYFLAPLIASAGSNSSISLQSYSDTVIVSGKVVVRLGESDDQRYALPQFDDTAYPKISFPLKHDHGKIFSGSVRWYRIHVTIPSSYPPQSIGIDLGTVSDTDVVFLNGNEIGRTGKTVPAHIPAYDKRRIYELPSHLLLPGKDNVIAIRVQSFFPGVNGPDTGPVKIGPMRSLLRSFMASEMTDLVFIVIYLVVVFYFAFVFVRKTIDREYLFFALFTAFSAVYLFLRTQSKYLITDDFYLLKRIEYVILFWIPVLMLEYMTSYYEKRNTVYHASAVCCAILASIVTCLSPQVFDWNRMLVYIAEPTWIAILMYCLWLTVKHLKSGIDAKYLFVSFVTIMIVFINDVLYDRGVISTLRLSTYGFLVVIIGTSLIMRRRYRMIFEQADSVSLRRRGHSSISAENRSKLDKAIAYISENFRSEISRENLAASIDLHEDYFGKLFKQYTGLKIGDYINELRVNEACRLLQSSDVKVIDAAYCVGFESLSTFYRAFQTVKNCSPGDWLESLKKKRESA